MGRKEDLLDLVPEENKTLLLQYVEEITFIEGQLKELKKDNFIRSHPNNPDLKKRDKDAIRQYKEFFQQYTNAIKTLNSIIDTDEVKEESPLRTWVKSRTSSVMDDIKDGRGLKPLC